VDVGGFPTLTQNSRPLTSIAGYPAAAPHGDDDGDGWTNLEEWMRDQSHVVETDICVDNDGQCPAGCTAGGGDADCS